MLSFCLVIQRGMRVTPLSLYLRVIVYEKNPNLEKTISSVISVLLLIYGSNFKQLVPDVITKIHQQTILQLKSSEIFK